MSNYKFQALLACQNAVQDLVCTTDRIKNPAKRDAVVVSALTLTAAALEAVAATGDNPARLAAAFREAVAVATDEEDQA